MNEHTNANIEEMPHSFPINTQSITVHKHVGEGGGGG